MTALVEDVGALPVTVATHDRRPHRRVVSPVTKMVCGEFNVRPADLTGPSRHRHFVRPRQLAMWLIKEVGGPRYSYPQIGQMFGGRDHTTVMHAVRVVNDLRDNDPEYRARVDGMERRLVAQIWPAEPVPPAEAVAAIETLAAAAEATA